MGASTVVDYHEPDWPERVRVLAGGGADAAANAARAGSVEGVRAARDGGRLATITADLPAAERDITMRAVQVARTADGSAASSSSSLRACSRFR
jgi:NADPH:quinone reductase-like Zn-dependent oxidoreductase